jgi:Tfp pilus assembly protein PilF
MPTADRTAQLYFDQGRNSVERREYDEASDYFRLAVERDPMFVEAHRSLAEAFEKVGYSHRARKAWEALARITTDEGELREIKQRIEAL